LKTSITKFRYRIILTIAVLIIFTSVWYGIVIPDINSLSTNYERHIEYEGKNRIVSEYGGQLGEEFILKEFSHEKVDSKQGDILVIHSEIIGINLFTDEIIFNAIDKYEINRITKKHISNPNFYYSFPTNVQKQNYEFLHPAIHSPATLTFSGVETIRDVETYVFTCSTSFDHSNVFPQFKGESIFVDYLCSFWIEPKTGDMIKFQISWDNYFIENGKRVYPVELGYRYTSEFATDLSIQMVKQNIVQLQMYEQIIPMVVIIGIVMSSLLMFFYTQYVTIKQKQQVEKFEMLGQLTANISHDIRNPLNTIKSTNFNLRELKNNPEEFEKSLNRSERAVNRIAHQIDDVMNYLRNNKLDTESLSLLSIINSSISDMSIPNKVKINLPVNDVSIHADKIKLEALFSNLILNSIQSMNNKGVIKIRISKKPNNLVEIDVEDNGPTIPEKNIKKIFEPLFTTKQAGTGLGLASCKKIVEQHHGEILVTNDPVTFRITLPIKN